MGLPRIGLVFTDVDGTLIGTSNEVPDRVWTAAQALQDRGIPVAVCSGRPAFGSTLDYAERLGPNGFHIFQNGASVVHLGTGESISRPIATEDVARLVARARSHRDFLELYADRAFAFEGDESLARAHARLLGVAYEIRPFSGLKSPIVRAQWIVSHEKTAATVSAMNEEFPALEVTQSTSPLMPDISFVMVTVRGVNKGSAVETIATRNGVPLSEVMFVGDGDNDVVAFERVGAAVVMSNGSEKARAAARYHVGNVDDGALAEAFALALES